MKNKFTMATMVSMAAGVLGLLLTAAPAQAEDARSDEAVRLSTDQTEYNASMVRLVFAPRPGSLSTLHAADNNAKALRPRTIAPRFPGG